jgi:signal transduction histidine kinase/CheY-like chemotaxis protein
MAEVPGLWFYTGGFAVLAGSLALILAWRSRKRGISQTLELEFRLEAEKAAIEGQRAEMERLLREAEQASRLKTEFLANVGHEIRTPMNAVLGMISLALETELTPEQREYLEVSKSSAESLLTVIHDVLETSRAMADQIQIEPIQFSLHECVENAVTIMTGPARQKGLDLDYSVHPKVPEHLVGDPARLRQILLNLVGNAIKFTERGRGEIRVDREPSRETAVWLHISVSDTGIGIAPEQHHVIFESFRQSDGSMTRRYGGLGLGLAICARLTQLMGGQIWVESEPGKGSTFHVTAQFGPGATRISSEPAAEPSVSLRVLVVEDNPMSRKLTAHLLERHGHQVALAGNGREAIERFALETFDLIVMDIEMPEVDGLAATRAIRTAENETGRRIPILMLTAGAMAGDGERSIEAGADGHVSKPVRAAELLDAIRAVTIVSAPEPAGQ